MITYVFNTTIAVPSSFPATMRMEKISTESAAAILRGEFVSAIGHEGSNTAIAAVTGVAPGVNRIMTSLGAGDRALCFKLRGRLPEGAIIDADACAKIGFDFILMTRQD